LGHLTKTLG